MPDQCNSQFIDRPQVLTALTHLREEWQEAADGNSLIETRGSVGLLLHDISRLINLSVEEQRVVLGLDLCSDAITRSE